MVRGHALLVVAAAVHADAIVLDQDHHPAAPRGGHLDMHLALVVHGQDAMPDAVLHVRLQHHGGQVHMARIHRRVDGDAVAELVLEAHVLKKQVQFQAFELLGQ